MTNSEITLYYGTSTNKWQLFEERNFIIDDIEDYLKTKESISRYGFQYQKIALDMNIKVDLGQEYALPFEETAIKYVRIIPSNEDRNYYFYVRNCEWISRSAVRLSIHLDTINTFKFQSYEDGYELSNETHITRQHKDRFTSERIEHSSYVYKTQVIYSVITSGIATLWDKLGRPSDDIVLSNLAMSGSFVSHGVTHTFDTTGSLSVLGITTSVVGKHPYYVWLRHYGSDEVEEIYIMGWKPYKITTTGDPNVHSYQTSVTFTNKNTEWGYSGGNNQVYIQSDELTEALFPAETSEWSTTTGSIVITFSDPEDWGNSTTQVHSLTSSEGENYCGYEVVEYHDDADITSTYLELVFEIAYDSEEYLDAIESIEVSIPSLDFEFSGSVYSSGSNDGQLSSEENFFERVIDYYPEGLNLPVYKTSEVIVEDSYEDLNQNWYILYMNQNELEESGENPVLVYICSQEGYTITEFSSETEMGNINLESVKEYYGEDVNVFQVRWSTSFNTLKQSEVSEEYFSIIIDNNSLSNYFPDVVGDKVKNIAINCSDNKDGSMDCVVYIRQSGWSSVIVNNVYNITYKSSIPTYIAKGITSPHFAGGRYSRYSSGEEVSLSLSSFADINRTDSRIIKLIELPYYFTLNNYTTNLVLPAGASTSSVVFDDYTCNFVEVSGVTLSNTIISSIENPEMNFLLEDTQFALSQKFTDELAEGVFPLESKLFNSDFYYKKAVYDSFGFVFPLERLVPRYELINPVLTFDFSATKTANSTFMFTFDINWKMADQDYPNVMVVSRNNQISLYSSEYLNYLRTGYNYDVKNKNLQIGQDWVSTAGNISVGSERAGLVTMGQSYSIASTFSRGIMGITNSILGTIQRENAINKKVTETKYETESVYGSDDVDLMEQYTNNRLKIVTYNISPQMENLVASLFHYTGYACNDYGIPDVTTRLRFNFVQAEIIFDSVLNFTDAIKSDITSKWADGVFFIHHYDDTWDLKLEYENYEKVLEPYLVKE